MRLWAVLPDENLTDDRAYLMGHLKAIFSQVMVTRASRMANQAPRPDARPDVVLNLVSARNRALLDDLDALTKRWNVPLSPPSAGSWRTEDKRTYLDDYADVSPPTRIARSIEEVRTIRDAFGGDIVVKDPFGDRGRGVERIRTDEDLPLAANLLEEGVCRTGDVVVQPYCAGFAKGDKRVVLQRRPDSTFEIVAYIFRQPAPGGWKSNIRSGGRSLPTELTDEEAEFALRLAPRTGIDNVGLDIAEHDGRLFYLEHNQGYGGIIDFDIGRDCANVKKSAEFLMHLALWGRPEHTARAVA